MLSLLSALLTLTRPLNVLITLAVVIVAGIIANVNWAASSWTLTIAALSAGLVAAGGNAVNDSFDVVIDRINRPYRPIPSGKITPAAALLWGLWLMMCGAAAGFYLTLQLGLIALLVSIILVLYSLYLKSRPFWGNLSVALCGALAFIYGASAVGKMSAGLFPAIFALLVHLAREIVKDAEDEPGDRAAGAQTLTIVLGPLLAQRLAAVVLLALAAATLIPYIMHIYGLPYLYTALVGVDLPALITSLFLWRGLNYRGLSRVSLALKIIMLTGLAALYVG
ncbi:MAG: geranylgeranylglycerol-phosphate geranylgeranyltransferase [Calditrichaeota bacterium]|nr:geranylgeranylglycerol-phosphate geranylgeranyltransferase [Calditrichota bacterium]